MQRYMRAQATRRAAGVSVAVVTMIAAAVGVTIWRYQAAQSDWARALDASGDATSSTALISYFWHEREAMNEYLIEPSPALMAEIDGARQQFRQVAAITTPETPAGVQSAQPRSHRERYPQRGFPQCPWRRGDHADARGNSEPAHRASRARGLRAPDRAEPAGEPLRGSPGSGCLLGRQPGADRRCRRGRPGGAGRARVRAFRAPAARSVLPARRRADVHAAAG